MATILELKGRFPRIQVTAFGFCVGPDAVVWPGVAEIHASRANRLTTDETFLEFVFGVGRCIRVSEQQPGFGELEAAMIAAFPATADWRQALMPCAPQRTLLFRRG